MEEDTDSEQEKRLQEMEIQEESAQSAQDNDYDSNG